MNPLAVKLASAGTAAAAAIGARRAVEAGWRRFRGEDPPTANGQDSDAQLRDLIVWSLLITGAVLAARTLAKRTTERALGD